MERAAKFAGAFATVASVVFAASLMGCASGPAAPGASSDATFTPGAASTAPAADTSTTPLLTQVPTSNYVSSRGSVTYLDGYTYFVAGGSNNDCTYNGSAESSAIWRIADASEAQPELVYEVPAEIVYGVDQDTLNCLYAAGDRVAFADASRGQVALRWVSLDGTQSGTYDVDVTYLRDATAFDGKLLLTTIRELNPDDPADQELLSQGPVEIKRIVVDVATGEVGQLVIPAIEGKPYQVVTMGDGYVYLVKYDIDAQATVNGLYRARIDGTDIEEVASLDAEHLMESVRYGFSYATADGLYYIDDETGELMGIDAATGTTQVILGRDSGFEYVDGWPNLCFAGNEIYFFVGADLYVCATDGSNVRPLIQDPNPDFVKGWMAVCDGWVYYGEYGINSTFFHRVATDGRIFPASPIVSENRDFEEQQEGDWTYIAYPKFACVTGYLGVESSVTVPSEIAGLPVLRVTGEWANRSWPNVTDLVIPEGVRALGYFETDHSMTLYLPSSLEIFTSGSLVSTFGTDTQVTVEYAGTMEQWAALCEFRTSMYEGIPENWARNVIVNCTDGTFEYGTSTE